MQNSMKIFKERLDWFKTKLKEDYSNEDIMTVITLGLSLRIINREELTNPGLMIQRFESIVKDLGNPSKIDSEALELTSEEIVQSEPIITLEDTLDTTEGIVFNIVNAIESCMDRREEDSENILNLHRRKANVKTKVFDCSESIGIDG